MARRLSSVVGSIGVASAVALLSAPAAVAVPTQTQTVTFTSTPPEGADWFGNTDGLPIPDYGASASASSGLPVTLSIDPASTDVCVFFDGNSIATTAPSPAGVEWRGPGTCTIHADQAGNDDYLPAPQATQSFVIEKVQPKLEVLRQRNWPLRTRTFRATLEVPTIGAGHSFFWSGYSGQAVTFSVGGHPVCSGTTDRGGVATCTATLSVRDWLKYAFVASYAGDARYKPVSQKGPTFGDAPPVQPEF
jgi:hypothetical protein